MPMSRRWFCSSCGLQLLLPIPRCFACGIQEVKIRTLASFHFGFCCSAVLTVSETSAAGLCQPKLGDFPGFSCAAVYPFCSFAGLPRHGEDGKIYLHQGQVHAEQNGFRVQAFPRQEGGAHGHVQVFQFQVDSGKFEVDKWLARNTLLTPLSGMARCFAPPLYLQAALVPNEV